MSTRAVGETVPAKNGMKPEVLVEPRPDRLDHRRQHQAAPQAVDDRRDRGEQVDQVAEARRQPTRRVVRDEQRDPERDRRRDAPARGRRRGSCRRSAARRSRGARSRRPSSETFSVSSAAGRGQRRPRAQHQEGGDGDEHDEDEGAGRRWRSTGTAGSRPVDHAGAPATRGPRRLDDLVGRTPSGVGGLWVLVTSLLLLVGGWCVRRWRARLPPGRARHRRVVGAAATPTGDVRRLRRSSRSPPGRRCAARRTAARNPRPPPTRTGPRRSRRS